MSCAKTATMADAEILSRKNRRNPPMADIWQRMTNMSSVVAISTTGIATEVIALRVSPAKLS